MERLVFESVEEMVGNTGKKYAQITFTNGAEWIPTMVELGVLLSKIGKIEQNKYNSEIDGLYSKQFINECFGKNKDEIEEIFLKYKKGNVKQETVC